MARWSEGGWKNSWWRRVAGKSMLTEGNGRSSWERQGIVTFCTCQWNEWMSLKQKISCVSTDDNFCSSIELKHNALCSVSSSTLCLKMCKGYNRVLVAVRACSPTGLQEHHFSKIELLFCCKNLYFLKLGTPRCARRNRLVWMGNGFYAS